MIINVKGVGNVKFPDDMRLADINKALTDKFGKEKPLSEKEITSIVQSIVAEAVKADPVINVKTEPKIEVNTPAVDMRPIAKALMTVMDRPEPPEKEEREESGITDIEIVERDIVGNIKRIRMTEVR